jgi:hypothetical protein
VSNKIKNQTKTEKISIAATQVGLILMAGAATLGMLDMPNRIGRIAIPNQPAFAWANNNLKSEENSSSMLRERDDIAPHYISYSEVQRTSSRSGRL